MDHRSDATAVSFVTDIVPPVADRYRQSLEFLFGRLNFERTPDAATSLQDFKLTRMEEFLHRLGNPQRLIPTVHVAGSKGKGSTSTMIARIAEAAGLNVGLFTSPHIDQFEERFTINGTIASPEEMIELVEQIRPVVDEMEQKSDGQGVTYFELATAMGWLHFLKRKVNLAVIEVGLGGRLDSTNVCSPLVTVITSISRDHTRLLGNTLAEIAREKAGIVKTGIPVVTAVTQLESAGVIQEIAGSHTAPLYRLGTEFQIQSRIRQAAGDFKPACYEVDHSSEFGRLSRLPLAMPGEHQARNAALAVLVIQLLNQRGYQFTEEHIRQGLENAWCPLRIEVLGQAPLLIVDAAHNEASVTALCESLASLRVRRRHLIFATSRDKEVETLLSILNDHFDHFWLTRYCNNPRSVPLTDLEALASRLLSKPWSIQPDPQSALRAATEQAEGDDLICVTGSFFLATEAKQMILQSGNRTGT